MTKRLMVAALLLAAGTMDAAPLTTPWGEKVTSENAWREYPRPQMVRGGEGNVTTILNGEWDYAITSVTNTPGRPEKWDGKIRVPFAVESALSGVGKLLEPDQFLWYTRKIDCVKVPGERILLHFDGVDFRTMVFIGHREVTDVPHEGGQLPFTLDITDYVTSGEDELTVCVWDPTESFVNSRGKQSFKPAGCFYTRVSGIWQTVWMERVPERHIRGYKVVTDIDTGVVRLDFDLAGSGKVAVKVYETSQEAASDEAGKVVLKISDAKLWSPEEPNLYHFKATFGKDVVTGYFGMRKFEKRKDANGDLRFFLNNKPYYVMATLDQGWWPDGLLTPPSDEAMAFDIKTLKDCGFNTMRKHIKVEPLRYYYLCDKMGLLVIQDLPSGNHSFKSPIETETTARYGLQRLEQKGMMDLLQAIPSIVMWNPYNEGWTQPGEFLTHAMLDFTRNYDPTRLVNGPSGCWDWEGGHLLPKGWNWTDRVETKHKPAGVCEAADTVDLHLYRGPKMFAVNDRRITFLGEFGGLGHPVEGHTWNGAKGWGYGGVSDTATREGLEKAYLGLMAKLGDLAEWGLAGSVYTQTTDVEIELNGLLTYDRKVLKYNPEVLRKAHAEVIRRATNSKRNELLYVSHVHRGGGKKEGPDNTLKTFQWCWANGSALECDCRMTKDGVGIMLHDDKLKRTARGISEELANKSVSKELTWAEIKDVDVGSYIDPKFADHRIPTIEETFAAMKGHPTYLCFVDEKGAGPAYIAKKAIEAGVQDQVYYTGPSHEKIFEWQKTLPGGKAMIWLGAWPKNHGEKERARADKWFRERMAQLRAKEFKFIDVVSIHTYYDPKDPVDPFVPSTPLLREMVNEFHANGIKVASIPFMGGEMEETYFKLHDLGFDGFSTDYPSVMFRVIKALKDGNAR